MISTEIFVGLLLAMRDTRGARAEDALREVREVATSCTDPLWRLHAALALGAWAPLDLHESLADQLAGAHDLARAYGWRAANIQHCELLEVSLAVGDARRGRNSECYAPAAIAAITAVADPRIAVLLEAELVYAPPSRLRDRLLVRLQRLAPAVELVVVGGREPKLAGMRIPLVLERDLIIGRGYRVRWQIDDAPLLLVEDHRLRPSERFTLGVLELEFRQTR
jgi:hypothetical protein